MIGFNEVILLVFLLIIALDLLALRNALRSQFSNGAIKLFYLLIILFLPFLGVGMYYLWAGKYKVK